MILSRFKPHLRNTTNLNKHQTFFTGSLNLTLSEYKYVITPMKIFHLRA